MRFPVALVLVSQALVALTADAVAQRDASLNLLLITADDMNWDAPGCYGCTTAGITPNIDRLAREGMRFERAHVTIAVCQPSRSVLMTGRYPHRNGARGFEPIARDCPTLVERLRGVGYLCGILGKTRHLAPPVKFPWHHAVGPKELKEGRSPARYGEETAKFLARAKAEGKPFFLMANSHDPHRPFAGSAQERNQRRKKNKQFPVATKHFASGDVEVPGFLPDIPPVRKEVAQYYTSVHRCDQTVGKVLDALAAAGVADSTLVMFLSDNGMAFPFAKTNCYLSSTKTPWIVRWPGRVAPGSVDREHYVSGIDYLPTVLEAAGLESLASVDGRSFAGVLRGEADPTRDHVYTVFHKTSGKRAYPMRALHVGDYGYIFNAWSDGQVVFRNESQNGLTFRAMKRAGAQDPAIAARVDLFVHRVPEELYDLRSDPNALVNLVADPEHRAALRRMRARTGEIMKRIEDPLGARFAKALRD